jgi:hypothetical protein
VVRLGAKRVLAATWWAWALAAPLAAADSVAAVDAALSAFEQSPADIKGGNELRRLCRERAQVGRCIQALDGLAARLPNVPAVRYHAALAYVDDLAGRSLLKQGILSTHSIDHMTAVLSERPDDWLALYIRGLNNLYWPTWFRRARRAVADLERCVELSEALPAGQGPAYHVLAYVALGDAQVRAGNQAAGREAWARGARRFPGSTPLRSRLALADDQVAAFVNAQRDLDKPIDTDLAFLWVQP